MNIYDKKEFDKNKYHWNRKALKKAKNFQQAEIIIKILCIMMIIYECWFIMNVHIFYYRTYFIVLFAIVIMAYGLYYALYLQRIKTRKKLKKEEQHDFILYEYHRMKLLSNKNLTNMAWLNIQLDRYDLAKMALEKINMGSCNGMQLQQIYFLQMIVATEEKEKEKAEECFIRCSGIDSNEKLWEQDKIKQEILNGNVENLKELFSQSLQPKKQHPLFATLIVTLLTYSIIFTGMVYGINEEAGYALRTKFILISLPIITLIPGILITKFVTFMHRANNKLHKDEQKRSKYLHIIRNTITVLALWALVGINALCIFSKVKGNEIIIKKDGQYTYLEVLSYTNRGRYRTDNPFIMKNVGSIFDQSQNKRIKQIPQENENTEQEILKQDSQTEELSPEDAMKAVYQYIKEQKMFPNMKLEYTTNAKGETYAIIHTTKERKDKKTLKISYTLYSNGTKQAKDGTNCEEIVLQKQYEDSNYETKLIDFYLVDPTTKKVTDEQKTMW